MVKTIHINGTLSVNNKIKVSETTSTNRIDTVGDYSFKPTDMFPVNTSESITGLSTLDNKWVGGALADNGKIYCCPYRTNELLVIDTKSDTYQVYPQNNLNAYPGLNYYGCVKAGNGKIYCAPSHVNNVGIIDPETNTIDTTTISGLDLMPGVTLGFAYQGAVLGPNGKVYFVPHEASNVLVVDPTDNSYSTIDLPLEQAPLDLSKWHGGVVSNTSNIYLVPRGTNAVPNVCVIDTTTDTADFIDTTGISNRYGYECGVLAPNGNIYCMPFSSSATGGKIMTIDPSTNSVDTDLSLGISNFSGALVATNNLVYGFPSGRLNVLIFNTELDTFDTTTLSVSSTDSYSGGVLAPNNKMYVIPRNATDIPIIKTGLPKVAYPWMMAPAFNKY